MSSRSATWQPPFWRSAQNLVRANEAEADRLIAAIWPHAYRIALSVVRDRGLAEDAAQEACAIVYREARNLRVPEAFNVWFYRIVARKALAIRKKEASFALGYAPCERGISPVDSDLKMDVLRALAQVTPRQRAIVALHYYAELSSREIGKILGIPDSTVRFHIMKTKTSLEKLLAGHAGFYTGEEER